VDDPKKLVRGLKDISPLFGELLQEVPAFLPPKVQVLGVSSPDHEGDSLLLNAFFASQLVSHEKPCTILSVVSRQGKVLPEAIINTAESFGDHLKRYCLYWDELRDLMAVPALPHAEGGLQSRDIFLDFEYRQLLHFERAICLLDKWVLLLKPTPESLTEGYKMMKVGLALNPQLEFFVTLSGKAEVSKGEAIFEGFSDFALKNLNTRLEWLGWMDLADPAKHFSSSLHAELLRHQPWDAKPSLQKFMLAEWIESCERRSKFAMSVVMR
jgi:hypothetical protein